MSQLIVVCDSQGFIGCYLSEDDAKKALKPFIDLNLVWFRFTSKKKLTEEDKFVYVIPYRGNNAVAFATTDPVEAKRVQSLLIKVEYTYEDDIKYWQFPIGQVTEDGKMRLCIQKKLKIGLTEDERKLLETGQEIEKTAGDRREISKEFETSVDILDCIDFGSDIGTLSDNESQDTKK